MIFPRKVLTLEEIQTVLRWHEEKLCDDNARYSESRLWGNLMIFRLATCCGLRAKEIRHARVFDVQTDGQYPALKVRKESTKGMAAKRKARFIPLWWDAGTKVDLERYALYRRAVVGEEGLLIEAMRPTSHEIMSDSAMAYRFKTAIACLSELRVSQLSIHCGRHSFCSHALRAGRSLAEVQEAAGHRSMMTTMIYLHALESGKVPDIFPREIEGDDDD